MICDRTCGVETLSVSLNTAQAAIPRGFDMIRCCQSRWRGRRNFNNLNCVLFKRSLSRSRSLHRRDCIIRNAPFSHVECGITKPMPMSRSTRMVKVEMVAGGGGRPFCSLARLQPPCWLPPQRHNLGSGNRPFCGSHPANCNAAQLNGVRN